MAEDLSGVTIRRFDGAQRYRALWVLATSEEGGVISAEVEAPYVQGSLRPEVTRLSAVIGEGVISITNCEATFGGDDEKVRAELAMLEALIDTEPSAPEDFNPGT